MTYQSIRIEELRKQAVHILVHKGATASEAETVVEDYLDAELRGPGMRKRARRLPNRVYV
jgi:LDH2 family malate/lactate/ureidoglycolate dehydrogenase